jgi:hypothetical protein
MLGRALKRQPFLDELLHLGWLSIEVGQGLWVIGHGRDD